MSFPGAVNIAVHQNRDKEINQLIILYFYGYTHILKPCFREISQKKAIFHRDRAAAPALPDPRGLR